jgi:hypothetical protein
MALRKKPWVRWAAAAGLLAAFNLQSAASAPKDGFVRSRDQMRIHYLQAGNPNAEHSLLLIPGWRVSASIWSKQIAYFSSQGFNVVAIDSRSQGGSSVARDGNAPEDRAIDIENVIAGLHLSIHDGSQACAEEIRHAHPGGSGRRESLAGRTKSNGFCTSAGKTRCDRACGARGVL